MKIFLTLCFCFSMVFCTVTAYSQGLRNEIKVYHHPDFSGTWSLNFVKSELKDIASKYVSDNALLILTVDQKLPVISVKVTFLHEAKSVTAPEFNIYTDGRASEIPTGRTASGGIAEWNGNKLNLTVFASPKDGNSVVVEVELSADRNTLIFTLIRKLTRIGPDGKSIIVVDHTRDITMIYDRIAEVPARSNKTPLSEENKQR